jgi:hypothetical protein
MTGLNELRARGADIIVQHKPPTYRLSSWTTLLSGATPETHGVTTNQAPRTVIPESLFHAAQVAGVPTALVGSQLLGDVFADDVQRFELIETPDVTQRDDDAIRMALEVLQDPANPTRLICIELTAIEDTARMGNLSSTVVSITDERIRTLASALDLGTNTLVVLSDHGLTAQGNSGGDEVEVTQTPMVMAGMGVTAGSQAIIKATDVAPTLAALVGTPLPVHAQGEPALPVLTLPATVPPADTGNAPDAPPEAAETSPAAPLTETIAPVETLGPLPALLWASATQLTTFYESWSEAIRQPRFAAEVLRAYQDEIRAGDTTTYQKFYLDLKSRANAAYGARLNEERMQRLPLLIGAALFLIALLGVALSSQPWQPLIGTGLYVVLWYVLFILLREHRFSLSMFANGDPAASLTGITRDSVILLAGVCVLVAASTGGHEDALEAISTVLITVMLIVCVQAAQAVWFYFQWGSNYSWNLPDSGALVTAMVALTQVSALSLRIVPELPNLPVAFVFAFITLIIYTLMWRRGRRERYQRLR